MRATLRGDASPVQMLRWESPAAEAGCNIAGPAARVRLPAWDTDRFHVELSVEGHPEMDAHYTLAYRRKAYRHDRTAPMNVTE